MSPFTQVPHGVIVRVRPAVGVLSEVPVTVGVPDAAFRIRAELAKSQYPASEFTNRSMPGLAYEVGSLMNKSSCPGFGTDSSLEIVEEIGAEDYQIFRFH